MKAASKKRIKRALAALARMPNEGSENRVVVPFPLVEEQKRPNVDATTLRGAVHGTVAMDSLYATQPTVSRKRVARRIEKGDNFKHMPTIIRMDGKNFIGNGHHRSTAAKLLGRTEMHCNIVAIDQVTSDRA